MKDDNSRYETIHIRILRKNNPTFVKEEWAFGPSDSTVFRYMKHLNDKYKWVSKKEISELSDHMYGLQMKPIPCAVPEFIDNNDLDILGRCIEGCLDILLKTSEVLHNKIDWEYAREKHNIKDVDTAYYLVYQTISSTAEIITSWLEILQI